MREFANDLVTPPNEAVLPATLSKSYADPKDVDEMAFALEIPELPLPADQSISSGMLRIKILINQHGKSDGIEVLETNLPDDYVAALVTVFDQGVFQPAILAGKPVNSWRVIDVTFGEAGDESNQPAKEGN